MNKVCRTELKKKQKLGTVLFNVKWEVLETFGGGLVTKLDSTGAKEHRKQYFFSGFSFLVRIHFFEKILL